MVDEMTGPVCGSFRYRNGLFCMLEYCVSLSLILGKNRWIVECLTTAENRG